MSLILAFQIGLWNAWMLIALNSLTTMFPSLINKEGVARAMGRGENAPQSSRTQKIVLLITHGIIMPATMFYSIFLPLKLETAWLYIGLPIGIACASWIFIVCALLWIICMQIGVIDEERFLLKKYGDAYREYIEQTPKWIGTPKSGKKT